jgi:protein-S-isoprenylcysteine O-methyltransferase Ste14
VTHGLYPRIRNPIYASVDIRFAGAILVLHWPWLFLVLFVIIMWQARRNARGLEETFEQEDWSYRQRTCF